LANPALGDFRSLEEMQTLAVRAKKIPAVAAAFKAYYLNQPSRAEGQWLNLEAWDECATTREMPEAGRKVYLGLDLASTRDLTALAMWFPAEDGTWDLRIDSWCPKATIAERQRADKVPYQQWVDAGWLTATPGNVTDYGFVEKRIYALAERYQVVELGADQWNAHDLVARLQQNNVPSVFIPQTLAQLTAPSKEFERLILERKLRHDGSPLVRWCVGNVVALVDSNENIKPDKRPATERKIDPVTAAITGLARALVLAAKGPSVYEARGVMTA
jgi:phage terminase large subunit-like protein